jgi:thiazole synthase
MAKRLENAGAVAIMPLAAPIGSGLGIQNKVNIKIIRSQTKLPLIIDAGIGQASDASIAMEMGCDGILVNTAIAKAKDPIQMAEAMKLAVISGRKSFLKNFSFFILYNVFIFFILKFNYLKFFNFFNLI